MLWLGNSGLWYGWENAGRTWWWQWYLKDTAGIRIWRHVRWSAFVSTATKLGESRDKISDRVQTSFHLCTPYVATNASNEPITKYRFSCSSRDVYRTWRRVMKTASNSSFCAVTADSEVYFRGVCLLWDDDHDHHGDRHSGAGSVGCSGEDSSC